MAGAEVGQDAGVSQAAGPRLVLEEGLGQVLLLRHLMIMIRIMTVITMTQMNNNDQWITFFLASRRSCSSPDSLSPSPPISFILLSLPPSTQPLMFSSRLDRSPESSCSSER